jgi:hypothetical protein
MGRTGDRRFRQVARHFHPRRAVGTHFFQMLDGRAAGIVL